MGSRNWKDPRKSGVHSEVALVTRLLVELEEHAWPLYGAI